MCIYDLPYRMYVCARVCACVYVCVLRVEMKAFKRCLVKVSGPLQASKQIRQNIGAVTVWQ